MKARMHLAIEDTGDDRLIGEYLALAVPAIDEIVTVDGDDYRVVNRQWAFDADPDDVDATTVTIRVEPY